jgi:hypothetical protein
MLAHELALTPLAILGVSTKIWAGAGAVVLALIILALVIARRPRGGKLEVIGLPAEHASRYLAEIEAAEAAFVDNPQAAVARARGLVEEVLRRMGFPDRIDGEQRLKDLQGYDRVAAQAMKEAYGSVRPGADTESLRRALQNYRDTLRRLLREGAPSTQGGSVSPEATVG